MSVYFCSLTAYISFILVATKFLISSSSGIARDFLNLFVPSGRKKPLEMAINSFSLSSAIAFFLAISRKLYVIRLLFSFQKQQTEFYQTLFPLLSVFRTVPLYLPPLYTAITANAQAPAAFPAALYKSANCFTL